MVILGGGFGGLYAARALRRAPVEVIVVDRRNFHLFQPLLYQVATAALAAPDIARPIRRVLSGQRNATVYMANSVAVDPARRRLVLDDGEIAYDFLILAPGAVDAYFGHDAWANDAPGLKTVGDALEIRRRIISAFERAERTRDPASRCEWLTFVIVGGGATGVEMAGALGEIAMLTLAREYRSFGARDVRVVLVEGNDRLLPTYPPDLSARAASQLERFGVEIRTGTRVTGIDAQGVDLGAERIASRTVVWAAGVRAHPILRSLGVGLDPSGRIPVAPDLTVPGHEEIYVIGDAAAVARNGATVPGVAQAAIQMGRTAAANIRRTLRGRPRRPFHYLDKGSLATIGRRAAVADFGRLHLWGAPAWLVWIFVHLFFLIGFRNRIIVLIEWAWAYVTNQRSASVIITAPRSRGAPHNAAGAQRAAGAEVESTAAAHDGERAAGTDLEPAIRP